MVGRISRLSIVGAVVLAIGLSLHGDSSAVYGDPRFYAGQAPSQLIHNYYPGDEFIVTSPVGTPAGRAQITWAAITAWNDAIRAAPNSINKYVFHYNQLGDPNANITIRYVSASVVDQHCGPMGDACNDGMGTIWVDTAVATTALVAHEMGHSLRYSDQYYISGNQIYCSPADTIMNSNAANCETAITGVDKSDFMYHHEPTYQSTDATYPVTWEASTSSVRIVAAGSDVEWKYVWEKFSDTGGSSLGSWPTDADDNDIVFGYATGNRFCVTSKIYNEVGYTGSRPWSPRSQYACVGAGQVLGAGSLVATSDRLNATNSTLFMRIKNNSSGRRNIAIFGPNLEGLGCNYAWKEAGQTYECYVTLGRGAYGYLGWFAWDSNNALTWGYLDFE